MADPTGRLALEGSLTLFAFVYPTLPKVQGGQCLMGRWDSSRSQGYCLSIHESGRLEFRVGEGEKVDCLQAETPLQAQIWYFVAATLDAKTGRATLYQEAIVKRYNGLLGPVALFDHLSNVSKVLQFRQKHLSGTPFLFAGSRDWHEKRGDFVSQLCVLRQDRSIDQDCSIGR